MHEHGDQPVPVARAAQGMSDAARSAYEGACVMVTGAGGSIGSELCQLLLTLRPKRIVLFEMSEFALYEVERRLAPKARALGVETVAILGSVADARLLRRVLARWDIDTILHAAAYKHVPMVEANPMAGMVNNVLGTQTLAEQALRAGVARFLLLSTDKAVRPASVMGATKRLAELLIADIARREGQTRFATMRFGNVYGSSGSVVPLFQEQIAAGGPLTVTHPQAERYFIDATRAAALVLEAAVLGRRGAVLVPDMGPSRSIEALARQLMQDRPVPLRYTGLRQGEKLREELSLSGIYRPTAHPSIFRTPEPVLSREDMGHVLRALKEAVLADSPKRLRQTITRWVEQPLEEPQVIPAHR